MTLRDEWDQPPGACLACHQPLLLELGGPLSDLPVPDLCPLCEADPPPGWVKWLQASRRAQGNAQQTLF